MSKNNNYKKNAPQKTESRAKTDAETKRSNPQKSSSATGFATNRTRITKMARVMAFLLIGVMLVFMLISSSAYLFN